MPSANEWKTVYTKDFHCLEGKTSQQQAILKKDNRIYNYNGAVDTACCSIDSEKNKETFCLSLLSVRT